MNDDIKDIDTRTADDELIGEEIEAKAEVDEKVAEIVDVADVAEIEETPVVVEEPVFDQSKEKSNFSRIGFGFVIFSGISMLVSLVIQIVVLVINEDFYKSHLFLNLLTPVSMYLFALPALIGFFKSVKPEPPKKRSIGFGEWLLYLIVGFGLMYIGALIGNGVMAALSALVGYDYSNALETVIGGGNIWITAIFVVIVAPIGEEFVFRKLLIDRTGKYGCFISALLSGLIFGLMHGNFYQFFYAAALGFMLGYLYYNTGKLIYTISIHAVINFFGSVLTTLLSSGLEEIDAAAITGEQMVDFLVEHGLQLLLVLLFNAFTYATMICAIILPIVFRKRLTFSKGYVEIPRKKRFATAFLNAGMICMIIFYIVEIAMSLIPV